MHSIGFRVFLTYWISVLVVIAIANFLGPDALRRPALIKQAVSTSLRYNAEAMTLEYERGGCPALERIFPNDGKISLASVDGYALCNAGLDAEMRDLVQNVAADGKLASRRFKTYQVVALPVTSRSEQHYVVLMRAYYVSPLQAFGWLPGSTTFFISGVMSIVLAFLLSRPLRKLRVAARELASGNLHARVPMQGWIQRFRFRRQDEIQALMHDFNEMAEHMQSLVESQRILLRDVSHELRSPLARLSLALEMAREQDARTMPRHLERIETEAARLNDLISQLLILSSLNNVHEVAQLAEIPLDEMLQELLPDMQYEASGKNCNVALTLGRTCHVRGYEQLLRRAVENVIRNAVHYCGSGGLVQVDLGSEDSGGTRHEVISVSDNGPGVPSTELKKIFRPFYRVDGARQISTGGFGIGLAIVERSIMLHSGKIVARNKLEGGLTVRIYLPATVSEVQLV